MALPRISIVTPSLNQSKYISETIESILSQDYPDLEYVIVDGGSSDGTVEIIRRYESRLSYWISEPDTGQSDAIMKGFNRCSGELFAWVNSDDVLLPGYLQAVARCYIEDECPDIVTANVAYIDGQGRITRYVRMPRQSRFFFFRGVSHSSAPAIFFKSSLFRFVGGVNLNLHSCMDFDIWVRMMQKGARVAHIPRLLGAFRWHPGNKPLRYFESPTRRISERELVHTERIGKYSERKVLFWRKVYKLYQILNLNYLREYVESLPVRGRKWQSVFPNGPAGS